MNQVPITQIYHHFEPGQSSAILSIRALFDKGARWPGHAYALDLFSGELKIS